MYFVSAIIAVLYFRMSLAVAREGGQQPLLINEPPLLNTLPFSPVFDKFVATTIKHFHIPGLSMAVINGNETCAKVSLPSSLKTCLISLALP